MWKRELYRIHTVPLLLQHYLSDASQLLSTQRCVAADVAVVGYQYE